MEETAQATEGPLPSPTNEPVATPAIPASPEAKYGSRLNKKVRVTEPRSITAVTHKVCNKCKQNLPAEAYCRQSNTSDGLNLWCKRCRSDRIKQWKKETWQKNAAARKEPDPEKQCAHCLETLPASAFFRDFSHRTGLEHFCKVCKKAIKTERLRVQREAVLLGLPIPRKRKAQAEQVFPEPVPLPPPEEGSMEPACKLTSRKPTPKKVPTHTRRPYKKRKQAQLLQPGDQAAAGLYPDGQVNSSAAPTVTLDVSSLPPEILQAYLQSVQEGTGPCISQAPGPAQPSYLQGSADTAGPSAGQEPGLPQPGYSRGAPGEPGPSGGQEPGPAQPGSLSEPVPAAGTYQALAAWASHGLDPQDLQWNSSVSSGAQQPGFSSDATDQVPHAAATTHEALSIHPLNASSVGKIPANSAAAGPQGHHSSNDAAAAASGPHQADSAAAVHSGGQSVPLSMPASAPPSSTTDDFVTQVASVLNGGLSVHQLSKEHQQELWAQFQHSQGQPIDGPPFEGRGLSAEQLGLEQNQVAANAAQTPQAAAGPASTGSNPLAIQQLDATHIPQGTFSAAQAQPQHHQHAPTNGANGNQVAVGSRQATMAQEPHANGAPQLGNVQLHSHASGSARQQTGHPSEPVPDLPVKGELPKAGNKSNQQQMPGVLAGRVVTAAENTPAPSRAPLMGVPQTSALAEPASKQLESGSMTTSLDQNSAPQIAPNSQAADFAAPQGPTGTHHGQQDPYQPDSAQPGSVGDDAFMQSLALEQLEYDSDPAFQMPGAGAIPASGDTIAASGAMPGPFIFQPAAIAPQLSSATVVPQQGAPASAQAAWQAATSVIPMGSASSTAAASTKHASQSLQPSSLSDNMQLPVTDATTAQPISTTLGPHAAPAASQGNDAGATSQPLPGFRGNVNESHAVNAAELQATGASLHGQAAAASGRNATQNPGPSQSAAWKTSINPFTGQPYAYMPTA